MDKREAFLNALQAERPNIRKDLAAVTSERFKSARTAPFIFHFEPNRYLSPAIRLKGSVIKHQAVSGKDVYSFDRFFTANEAEELRKYSSEAHFDRKIFADRDSKAKGETPDRAMDEHEKWTFFTEPPQAVNEIYKLLGWLANAMNADITTLPWEMYDQNIACVPAVASNRVESKTAESMELGKHQDYNTEEGVCFGIPVLYPGDLKVHPDSFVNGAEGKPWLISLMLYSASEKFSPDYGMGTTFYEDSGKEAFSADSLHTRFVIFEGNIIHSIEKSKLPQNENVWRVSYVFKLVVNPRDKSKSMKDLFLKIINALHPQ